MSPIRAMLPEKIEGIKVLVGCETEYLGKGLTGMSKKTAGLFDYVLVLTNHNLTGFAKKEKLDTEENRQIVLKTVPGGSGIRYNHRDMPPLPYPRVYGMGRCNTGIHG